MMTSAQFRLYLGKYDKAAEDLIQAIETSHPHQAVVLQKVCQAVKAKVKSDALNDRCNLLNNPDSLKAIQTAAQAKAPAATQPASAVQQPASPAIPEPAPVVEQAKPAEQPKEQPKAAPAPTPAPVATAPAATTPAAATAEYWTLQLGAFGTKSNADLLVTNLKKQKITSTIIEMPRGEKILYLVQTGHFDTKDQAVDYAATKLVPLKIEYQPLLKK
jgi:cell division septation protein DedD